MSWRPIDIAPRDGTRIVVAFRSMLTNEISASVAAWSQGAWRQPQDADPLRTITDVAIAWIEIPVTSGFGVAQSGG